MRFSAARPLILTLVLLFGALLGRPAQALNFDVPLGDERVHAVLNSTITLGGGVRTQSQSSNLIAKSDLYPNGCGIVGGVQYQTCQATFRDQIFPSQRLYALPGAASSNFDDGDLNYGKGQLFSSVVKVTEDFKAEYQGFGVFLRALYFHDWVNNNFTEHHPNEITAQNRFQVGIITNQPIGLPYPSLDPNGLSRVYGRGGVVDSARTDGEVLRQVGNAVQYLDSYFYGSLPLWGERSLSFKIGRQVLNWGESTTIVNNSLNNVNPVNLNNVYRIGGQTEEFFIPTNLASLSLQATDNLTLDGYYQLEWQPDVLPAPGSYFSTTDLGTNSAIGYANGSFAQVADDPQSLGRLTNNPLALLAGSSGTLTRLADVEPRSSGQYGVKLDYYADWLNGGTTLALYYEHYHSRIPYVSLYAGNPSCARAAGSRNGVDATSLISLLLGCPDFPILGGPIDAPTSGPYYGSIFAADSARVQFQYPENIDLAGISFNTTIGNWSLQGEVAYRPNLPLQVDLQDLLFAAAGPALTNCGDPSQGYTACRGSGLGGVGYDPSGAVVRYGGSDFLDANGNNPYPDTIDTIEGVVPNAARAFPNFIIPYRGGRLGSNPGCPNRLNTDLSPEAYAQRYWTPGSPCWIQGWERFQAYQFNLGTTRVLGRTENELGADQVQLVGEFGATWVPTLPALDVLQIEAPGTYYAASAGADGSGADGSRQACSTAPDCVQPSANRGPGIPSGADGVRFNPHQQDLSGFPDKFSWGYRIIAIAKYESVLPGISVQPTLFYAQDVQGTSPDQGADFIAGRRQTNLSVETRYKSSLAFNLGYTWFWGGGQYNLLSDRDFASFYVKYQF